MTNKCWATHKNRLFFYAQPPFAKKEDLCFTFNAKVYIEGIGRWKGVVQRKLGQSVKAEFVPQRPPDKLSRYR